MRLRQLIQKEYFLIFGLITSQAFLYQNCSKVAVQDAHDDSSTGLVDTQGNANPSDPDLSNPSNPVPSMNPPSMNPPPMNPPPTDPVHLMKSCDDAKAAGKLVSMKTNVLFDDDKKVCDWGHNGNLSTLDKYVRARIEKYQTVTIPANATICDIQMEQPNQSNFHYDDNIIMTLNDYIMASTTDFSKHFTASSGFYKYDWSQLVTQPAQNNPEDTVLEKQYCAGQASGLAFCSFPQTETFGKIQLQFDERVIQQVLGMTTPRSLKLGVITTGDNDSTDCQHTPINLSVEVVYYQ